VQNKTDACLRRGIFLKVDAAAEAAEKRAAKVSAKAAKRPKRIGESLQDHPVMPPLYRTYQQCLITDIM
jgi:hypothetical protein